MTPLHQLRAAGQSVWLDYLRRGLLTSGGLDHYVHHDAVTGVTSNPTIFGRAIAGSTDYDEAIARLAALGAHDPREVFYELAIDDIRMAADVLRPVHADTNGVRRVRVVRAGAGARPRHRGIDSGGARHRRQDRQAQRHDQGPRHARRLGGARASSPQMASTSTSRSCSPSRCTSRWHGRTRPGSNGASPTRSRSTRSHPSPRSSCPGSTPPSIRCSPRDPRCRVAPRSPTPSSPTSASARCSPASAGSGSPAPGARVQRPLVGIDGHEEPRLLRRPLRRGPGRSGHRQHDARAHPGGLPRPRAGST